MNDSLIKYDLLQKRQKGQKLFVQANPHISINLNERYSQNMFQQGDLVFAKCTKSWPAKILKVFNQTTFKVDFYNHNSFAIVDQKDLEFFNQNTLQYYRQIYKKQKNNEEVLALEGIRLAQIQFNRRADLHRIESKKWFSGVPNATQKKEFQKKMKKQIQRPVIKPKQIQKKQTNKVSKKTQPKRKQLINKIKQIQTEDKSKQEKPESTVRTRSRYDNNEDLTSKQANKQQPRDSSKLKNTQPKQKSTPKQKKIKKQSKKKRPTKQNKKKQANQKQENNKNSSQQCQNKVETIVNQSSKQESKQGKEILQQKLHNSEENPLNASSMIQENDSYISLPVDQKPKQIVESARVIQEQRIQTNSHSQNRQQVSHQMYSFPSSYVHYSESETVNKESSLIVEKDRTQESNSFFESNPLIQGINQPNKQESNQINKESSEAIVQSKPLQDQNQNHIQIQETIQVNEQNNQNKMTFVNNLDLSPQSFEVSLSQESIKPQKNDLKDASPHQQREQIQLIHQNNKEIGLKDIQQEKLIHQQLQPRQIPPQMPEERIIQEEKIIQNQEIISAQIQNIVEEIASNQQKKEPLIEESNLNQRVQNQSNVQCLKQPIIQENNLQILNAQDENSQKCNQNQQAEQTYQNLTPATPNLLFKILNKTIPLDLPQTIQNIDLEQQPQTIIIEQNKINVQPVENVIQEEQKQPPSVNSSIIANNINLYQVDLKDIQISSDTPQHIDNSCKYFQRMYGDFSINNRDYIKMVRGIPELKKELQNSDKKLIAICTNQYLKILTKFIGPQSSSQQMNNLEMWQRQLLISILDTDTLDLKILVQYQIMFNMMSFIRAFQQNKTSKRAQCHVQYLFTVTRLDTYLNRYIKQRYKQELMHKASSYDQLIRQFHKRIQT